jgi:hypothetical protein
VMEGTVSVSHNGKPVIGMGVWCCVLVCCALLRVVYDGV